MRPIVPVLVVVAAGCVCSSVRADDKADAQKAFDLFVQYSKVADKRLLDLFAPDVSVTLVHHKGESTWDVVLPTDQFFDIVKESIAAKDGDNDAYDEVKCESAGDTVKLTCKRVESGTGKREPFLLIYGKDAAGRCVIKAMKMTLPEDA